MTVEMELCYVVVLRKKTIAQAATFHVGNSVVFYHEEALHRKFETHSDRYYSSVS